MRTRDAGQVTVVQRHWPRAFDDHDVGLRVGPPAGPGRSRDAPGSTDGTEHAQPGSLAGLEAVRMRAWGLSRADCWSGV